MVAGPAEELAEPLATPTRLEVTPTAGGRPVLQIQFSDRFRTGSNSISSISISIAAAVAVKKYIWHGRRMRGNKNLLSLQLLLKQTQNCYLPPHPAMRGAEEGGAALGRTGGGGGGGRPDGGAEAGRGEEAAGRSADPHQLTTTHPRPTAFG